MSLRALRSVAPSDRYAIFCTLLVGLFFTTLGTPAAHAASPIAVLNPSPILSSLPNPAIDEAVVIDDESQLRARLLVSSDPSPRVGVLFDLAPGWHLYWRNPGGTGIAPELGLEVSEAAKDSGVRLGEVAWPAPQTFEEGGGLFTTWGYEGSVLLSVPLEKEAGALAADGNEPLGILANPRVLICRTQCVPAELSLSSSLSPRVTAADQSQIDALFEHALAQAPVASDTLGLSASASWTSNSPATDEVARIELVVETCRENQSNCPELATSAASSLFLPIEAETFEYAQAEVLRENGAKATGRFVVSLEATRLEEGADRLWGLVPIRDAQGRLHFSEIDVPIGLPGTATSAAPLPMPGSSAQTPPPETATASSPSAGSWIQIFFLALLGGLILNGMPCVLPVLAIKVFSIAEMAEKDPREVRLHGLAYTAGVMGSMALLAAVVLTLRSAGHSVGWGFQFQEPLFVAAISAVLVTFALNLFGIFEIEFGQGKLASIGQESTGLKRSVFEGLLAVVLATPCTAPFLGTAVGFAFASSGFGIAAIFLAIGLGLASPFLIVSFLPQLARFIPRSGPWMNTLRAGLGFCLLATVVWLLWILGQTGGATAVVSMTGVLLFLAFLLWTFGQLQPIRSPWLGRASAVAIATLAFAGFNLIEFDRTESGTDGSAALEEDAHWQTYSEEAVAKALAAGKPAFVVFTADWCITCQVNERTVLDRETILSALSDRNYTLFKADWTRRDETIRAKLAEFGRAGVPLYLVYRPTEPNRPVVLSELLTQQEVLAALKSPSSVERI